MDQLYLKNLLTEEFIGIIDESFIFNRRFIYRFDDGLLQISFCISHILINFVRIIFSFVIMIKYLQVVLNQDYV
jgi:hypothetical protein